MIPRSTHRAARLPWAVILAGLLSLALVMGLQNLAQAQAPTPGDLPGNPIRQWKEAHSRPGSVPPGLAWSGSVEAAQADAPTSSVADWSLVAASMLMDTGWEIVTLRSDGQGLRRLTNDSALDLRPSLDRTGARIAFASDRTGNREIFVVNADGSNLHQLTSQAAKDDYPQFFLNADRLVFASERDGNWEIYVMNGDGSGQTRLTADPSGEDYYPAVSPDGSQIAWIKYTEPNPNQRQWQLWLMNADGSNPHPTPLVCSYMQNVFWQTPQDILVDCDQDGDLWNEVATYRTGNGSVGTLVDYSLSPSDYVDTWVGGTVYRSLVGASESWLALVLARYQVVNNQLQLVSLDSELKENSWQSVTVNNAVAHTWQKTDWDPPVTWLRGVPDAVLSASQFRPALELAGYDVGAAGLARFAVQYQVNGSAWFTAGALLPGEDPSFLNFDRVTYGDQVGLRVYGVDQAENVEDPEGKTPQRTHYYRGAVQATVQDLAGFPVALAQVTGENVTPKSGATTDGEGGYTGYVIQNRPAQITVTHAAFQTGHVSATIDYNSTSLPVTVTLWPTQNLLQDGGFEQNALVDWAAQPVTHAVLSWQQAQEGQQALVLGQNAAYFQHIQRRAESNSISYNLPTTALAYGADGTLHLLQEGVYYACQLDSCGPGETLIATPLNAADAVLQARGSALAAAWRELNGSSESVRYALRGGSGWQIETVGAPQNTTGLDMALDSQGEAHVVWTDSVYDPQAGAARTLVRYRKRGASGWEAMETVYQSDPGLSVSRPRLLVDSQDRAHLFFAGANGLMYMAQAGDGSWSAPTNLLSEQNLTTFDVAMDAQDRLHLAIARWGAGVFYRMKQSGAWGGWQQVAPYPSHLAEPWINLGVLSDGLLVLENSDGRLLFSQDPESSWSGSHVVGPPSLDQVRATKLATGPDSWVAMLTREGRSDGIGGETEAGLFLYQFVPVEDETGGRSALERTFTVPATMDHPVFHLEVAFTGEKTTSNPDRFRVEIDDGQTVTRALELDGSSQGWKGHTISLAPWQGQSITLTLAVDATDDDRFSWAWLDNLWITSWETPRIQEIALLPSRGRDRVRLPYGVGGTLVITGENFIETPAVRFGGEAASQVRFISSERLEADVPASLAAGIYDVVVTNPGGVAAVRSSGLTVGELLYLPLVVQ